MPKYRLLATLFLTGVLIGSALLLSSASGPVFTEHDKAYYADAATVNFVRPGLALKILSAGIATDGTISVRFRISDPKGLPLDLDGIVTPGAVTASFVAAYIPKGEAQYRAYSTRVFTNSQTGGSVTDPWTDAGGKFAKNADGEYTYTFNAKAPANFDTSVTTTIGGQAARNLTEFSLGTQYDNDVYTFVPDGSAVKVVRDVVRTTACNRCHDPLAVHGNGRRRTDLCILCHQPQNVSPYGDSLNFPYLIHRLHRGADLPSVKAGTPLLLNGPHDFSGVVFPAGVRNCEVCHDPNSGAAQADAWLKPNRVACGACHDNVNFATGDNHVDLPQPDDNMCANCHIPLGENENDASIRGAHLDPRFSAQLPGTTFKIISVNNGAAGQKPAVTFTVTDKTGAAIPITQMDRVALVLAGPAADYTQATMQDVTKTATANSDGSYTATLSTAIPADAAGTFSVGIEGTRTIKLNPGTKKEISQRDSGINQLFYFSVDGSTVAPRRMVVDIDKCNVCHLKLDMHGTNRNRPQHCVQCHNPNNTDGSARPAQAMPAQTIAFKTMIHRIHTGSSSKSEYTIYSPAVHDFTKIMFPGDTRDCEKCHINNSYKLPLPDGLLDVVNPRGKLNPMGATAAACMGCHTSTAVASHAEAMTTSVGESCAVCHGTGADYAIEKVHAR